MSKRIIRIIAFIIVSVVSAALRVNCTGHIPSLSLPSVTAESAFVIETSTNQNVFEYDADKKLSMASTTKIMTALVAIENAGLNQYVEIPGEAVGVEGSSAYLKQGDTTTLKDLLYSLLLESANDSAVAIAIHTAGSVELFTEMMNDKAMQLGLVNTHFANPHGLDDPDHYTTARDLGLLTVAALKNKLFSEIVSTYSYDAFENTGSTRTIINHNRLLKTLDGAVGVKTGFTKRSGRCLVSAVDRNGVITVVVTLNDPTDWSDHKKLHEYAQSRFERRTLAETGKISYDLPVIGGDHSTVRCTNSEEIKATVKKNAKITVKIEADRFLPSPVKKGDALAKAIFFADGKIVCSAPLFAERDVKATGNSNNLFERFLEFLVRKSG